MRFQKIPNNSKKLLRSHKQRTFYTSQAIGLKEPPRAPPSPEESMN